MSLIVITGATRGLGGAPPFPRDFTAGRPVVEPTTDMVERLDDEEMAGKSTAELLKFAIDSSALSGGACTRVARRNIA